MKPMTVKKLGLSLTTITALIAALPAAAGDTEHRAMIGLSGNTQAKTAAGADVRRPVNDRAGAF